MHDSLCSSIASAAASVGADDRRLTRRTPIRCAAESPVDAARDHERYALALCELPQCNLLGVSLATAGDEQAGIRDPGRPLRRTVGIAYAKGSQFSVLGG